MSRRYEVAIVGAGVVGCAIARELTNAGLRCALVEADNDIGKGASKANTGILHTGFDAPVGSLEARLVARGHALLTAYAAEAGIATEAVGALLVAWSEAEAKQLDQIVADARANGYGAIRRITSAELYELEPFLAPGAAAALLVPDEQIICPFTTTLAFATEAVTNGCDLSLNSRVCGLERGADAYRIHLATGDRLEAHVLVNAAGSGSDTIHALAGYDGFRVKPRRGQLLVFDKLARRLLNHILLPTPTPKTKGILIAPTVYGNVLVGPTSEDVLDGSDRELTEDGIQRLLQWGSRALPAVLDHDVTAAYAGVRAATEPSGYQFGVDRTRGYVWTAGIRSTGVSASMAIAEWVRVQLGVNRHQLRRPRPAQMPPLGERQVRPYQSQAAISANPDFGIVVCFCERVTRGEIAAALRAPIPARDADGLRRRTRAQMGRCQGFFCGATITSLVDERPRLEEAIG
jgi:glycerol-3-phosphate dehydrogenase